jgi:hypothetical protein
MTHTKFIGTKRVVIGFVMTFLGLASVMNNSAGADGFAQQYRGVRLTVFAFWDDDYMIMSIIDSCKEKMKIL